MLRPAQCVYLGVSFLDTGMKVSRMTENLNLDSSVFVKTSWLSGVLCQDS